jgi:D-mannose binding lectin
VLQCVNDSTLPNHGPNNNWSNQPESPTDVEWVPVWSTRTDNQSAAYMDMQIDGNLVIYNGQGQAIWATNTQGNTLAFLRMQDDGNLVITSQQGQTLWASSTSALQAPGVNA